MHLELVTDLTTEAFIACLKRFVARHGLPSVIMSDHGSNFIGADRELDRLHTFINSNPEMIAEFCASQDQVEVYSREVTALRWALGSCGEECKDLPEKGS